MSVSNDEVSDVRSCVIGSIGGSRFFEIVLSPSKLSENCVTE